MGDVNMKTEVINQNVAVTAVRFGRKFEPIPQRIEFGGRSISFIDDGIRIAIKSGQRLTRLFDMSDGTQNFRLRQMADDTNWQLVSISR